MADKWSGRCSHSTRSASPAVSPSTLLTSSAAHERTTACRPCRATWRERWRTIYCCRAGCRTRCCSSCRTWSPSWSYWASSWCWRPRPWVRRRFPRRTWRLRRPAWLPWSWRPSRWTTYVPLEHILRTPANHLQLDSLPLVDLPDSEHHQASVDRPASLVVVDLLVSVADKRTMNDHNEISLERFGIGPSNTARAHTTHLRRYLGRGPNSRPTRRKGLRVPKLRYNQRL